MKMKYIHFDNVGGDSRYDRDIPRVPKTRFHGTETCST